MSPTIILSSPSGILALLRWHCPRHLLTLRVSSLVPFSMPPVRLSTTSFFLCRPLVPGPPAACSRRPPALPAKVRLALHPAAHVDPLLPRPAPRHRPPQYQPSLCNSSLSIRTLGCSPHSWGQSRFTPGAPLQASSSTCSPPSPASFPVASPPCRPGCRRNGSPASPAPL